jgi:hypothetical protein
MKLSALILVFGGCMLLSSCGGSSPNETAPSPLSPTVSSVVVSGSTTLTSIGQTVQLTATAMLSDGSIQSVTSTAAWQSSNASVATVSPSGLVTAVASGAVTITATLQAKSGTASVGISLTTSSRSSMRATIDGVSWTAVTVSAAKGGAIPAAPAGFLSIGGTNSFSGQYVEIAVAVPAAVGTYDVSSSTGANTGLQIPNASSSWSAGPLGGNGTVTLTTLTATGATGTFSFTAVPLRGTNATGDKVVTNGVFDVTF